MFGLWLHFQTVDWQAVNYDFVLHFGGEITMCYILLAAMYDGVLLIIRENA
jgi:hypothetical protein